MDTLAISLIISELENMRKRPVLYMPVLTATGGASYLYGFVDACHVFGHHVPYKIKQRITEAHGWEWTARGTWCEMQERGLSDVEVIDELISIEIDRWKCYLENTSASVPE